MSHFLTEDQILMRNIAREFAEKEVEPLAIEMDIKDQLSVELIKRCADLNFFGIMIPEEYGGLGLDATTAAVVLEEISKASPALAGLLSVQIALCPVCINLAGTEEQKKRYLVPSASGEQLIALSQTEPSGSANTAAHETRLTPDGDGYRLNGLKIFCTQGTAVNYIVTCQTSEDGENGYGVVIVEKGMEGFDIGKYEDKLGWRGSNTGTLIFKNVFIPKENVLGSLLYGSSEITLGNMTGNLGHCATALGCAEGIYQKTKTYVMERNLYGYPMKVLQPISYWIAESYMQIEACRALLYNTLRMIDSGEMNILMVLSTKAFVCRTAFDVTNKCLQMWGGHGIMNEVGINRYFRDARTKMIAEGSDETMLGFLAQMELG